VTKALAEQAPTLRHGEKCLKVLENRCLAVLAGTLDQCVSVANYIAPEHLELQVKAASIEPLSRAITTAGAILQGYATPTVVGDFTAGPSHTLPTGRAGRFFSGLQATDFMRRSSTVRYDAKSLAAAAPVVEAFARLEQLDAHGKSLQIRLSD
jgi:histidinol dehydrogenase